MRAAVQMSSSTDDRRSGAIDRLAELLDDKRLKNILDDAIAVLRPEVDAVGRCSIKRVHPRRDGSLVIDVAVEDTRGNRSVCFVEIMIGDAEEGLEKVRRWLDKQALRRGAAEAPTCVHIDRNNGLCIRPGGFDELIDGLVVLKSVDELEQQFPDVICMQVDPDRSAELLAHRLHRRAVLSLEGFGGEQFILKLYKKGSDKARRAIEVCRMLELTSFNASSPIRVPRTVTQLTSWPGYLMNRERGAPVHELEGTSRLSALQVAGSAIGRLHRLPLRMQESHLPAYEVGLLRSWVKLVADVRPDLASGLWGAFDHVSSGLERCRPTSLTLVHRDYHEGQLLISDEGATLLDFDTVSNGDPAQDIGNFLAHLDFAALCAIAAPDGELAFIDGYARAYQMPDPSQVRLHRSATCLRLACIYAFSAEFGRFSEKLAGLARR